MARSKESITTTVVVGIIIITPRVKFDLISSVRHLLITYSVSIALSQL